MRGKSVLKGTQWDGEGKHRANKKRRILIHEDVETHESNRTTSGGREEEKRSFVIQKLARYTEALIGRLERGKKTCFVIKEVDGYSSALLS